MKTYTINAMTSEGVESFEIRAKNIKEATIDTAALTRVFRFEGRKGEYNEYVEFDPRNQNKAVFIAQRGAGGEWFVFESYPGAKGRVITHAHYSHKYLAVHHAMKMAFGH